LTVPDFRPKFMLLAIGVYDIVEGRLQAIANSPTYPPKLPLLKHHNVRYPSPSWLSSSKGCFQPSRCPFLVDIVASSIGRDDFLKESLWQKKRDSLRKKEGYQVLRKRDYVDVHLEAKIRSMDKTCINATSSMVDGDLLRYDKFILKTSEYAVVATCLSLLQVLIYYFQIKFSTPASTAMKMSLISVLMHSVFDAYICMVHLIMGLYMDDLFTPFLVVFFLQFFAFSILDLRLVILLWKSRWPIDFSSGAERARRTLTKI